MNTFLVKCKCQHCNQSLEFEADRAGETVPCPNCGMDTQLFIPQTGRLPEPSKNASTFSAGKISALAGGILLLAIAIILLIVFARLTDDGTNNGPGAGAMIVSGVLLMCATLVGFLIYFAPALVAHSRKKRNFSAILVLNLLTGWTFLGWVIALVWACTVDPETNK